MAELKIFNLRNSNGVRLNFLNYGGIVHELFAPDKFGKLENVIVGFDDPRKYLGPNPAYFGALIGRFANRIGNGSFELDGKKYSLAQNNGTNSLHGGLKGFDKVYWSVEELDPGKKAKLSYLSPDMEEGYPGNLKVDVIYSLNDRNEFAIEYTATTDKPTLVNLTQHSYFNLSGGSSSTILDHTLQIDADKHTPNIEHLPTGEIAQVSGATDFRKPMLVGKYIHEIWHGYDHNFVLNKPDGKSVVATLAHEKSGRVMEVMTTQPGLQFYSGYYSEAQYGGLALEAQHFPDAPNKPHFPSAVLRPGETYHHKTTYRFRS